MADARLLVAKEFLEDAKLCLDNGRFRSAVSRAHACIGLFVHYGYRPSHFVGWGGWPAKRWEHGVVFKHFPLEFVQKRKLVDWRIGTIPRRLYKLRIRADYKMDLVVTQALVRDAYEEAKRLVQVIEQEIG